MTKTEKKKKETQTEEERREKKRTEEEEEEEEAQKSAKKAQKSAPHLRLIEAASPRPRRGAISKTSAPCAPGALLTTEAVSTRGDHEPAIPPGPKKI